MIIYTQFNNLNRAKKERILNAAIKQFLQSGFDKASTNKIVQEAGISKGSLFNYFNSKKDLYIYLIDYGSEIIDTLYKQIDYNETDIFNRLKKLGIIKLTIQKRFPLVFDFLTSLANEESVEVKDAIAQRRNLILGEGLEILYENIDYSKFREEIDIQKALEIVTWTMLGFSEKALKEIDTFENISEEYLQEWKKYSDILKVSFYKKEDE